MSDQIRVTQLFDCADVGKTIVKAGVSHGKPWKIIQGPWTRGGTKTAYYRFRLEQAAAYPRTQLWHVNMGGRAKWARGMFSRPYVLTLHGTDIRENYWQDQHHAVMKGDIDGAGHVWYMTPDVREKAESVRPDAEYFPIPVEPNELPAWNPASRPRVFFPSRWDASKGGDALLKTAADVVAAVGQKDVDIVGLDWGDRAAEAAGLGVTLLPRMPKDRFLLEMASAHVAVGQVAGILATSELEALGIGVPVVVADPVPGYPDDLATVSVARADVGQAVLESLQDPRALSRRLDGPSYVRRNHSAEVMLPRLEAGYAKALENAR
jgi:glycosyltransferase involved in cell wall biosynthesis